MADENYKDPRFCITRGSLGLGGASYNFDANLKAVLDTQCKPSGHSSELRGLHLSLGRPDTKPMSEGAERQISMDSSICEYQKTSHVLSKKFFVHFLSGIESAVRKTCLSNQCLTKRNRNGFAILQILIFLPVLITLIIAGGTLQSTITRKSRQLHQCRLAVLKVQTELSKELQALLSLNKKALLLRRKKAKADYKLKLALASGNPAAITACRVEIAYITSMQLLLDSQQKLLITHSESIYEHWRLKHNADRKSKALSVRPDHTGPAPLYKTENDFTRKQRISIGKPANCAASLSFETKMKGKQKCYAHLVAVRS